MRDTGRAMWNKPTATVGRWTWWREYECENCSKIEQKIGVVETITESVEVTVTDPKEIKD